MQNGFLYIALIIALPAMVRAQDEETPHTELDWKTIETPHFLVHFHNGGERTARSVAVIAEEVYEPVTRLYQRKPDQKVSFVIRDHDDYSNGAAYFFDNKIEIWASSMDFELRGVHPWLRNVVTHEFTHIVQIQTAMKMGRRVPAIYFQWFGYESERRPDVLYGFPNVLVSYPLSGILVPSWFAEGTAQYNDPDLRYDYWDSHRDMILRMYMIDGNPLSWEDMAVFGKTSLGNESSYNAGFSIVQFIAETYGVDKLKEISSSLASFPRVTIDGAIQSVLSKSGEQLYQEWKERKTERYVEVKRRVEKYPVSGTIIEHDGFGNFYPVFSPGGDSIVYVSNKGNDTFGQSAVYVYDFMTRTSSKLIEGVRSTLSISRDGRYLYYAKITGDNPHWSRLSDLYRYDLKKADETRLTYGLRAHSPRLSPDGSLLVFASGSDGTLNVGVCDTAGKNVRMLTSFRDGDQVYTPVWSPDGREIAFGYSRGHGQSVALVGADGNGYRMLVEQNDSRNPFFSGDGKFLYFSSDRTGIFNIYSLELETGRITRITNVLGGAFLPAVNSGGDLAFASYTSSGYKLAYLSRKDQPVMEQNDIIASSATFLKEEENSQGRDSISIAGSPGTDIASAPRPYRNTYTSLSIIPMIRVDTYNPFNKGIDVIKAGLYAVSSEILNKMALFAGGAINRKLERDLFLIVEYRDRLPLFSLVGLEPVASFELYNISRSTTSSFTLDPSPDLITPEISYSLFEVDFSLRHRLFNEKTEAKFSYALSRYSANIGAFVNPNTGLLNPAFRNTYLIGNTFTFQVKHRSILPTVDTDINPIGRSILLRYAYESNKFNPEGEFDIEDGILVPRYTNFIFHRGEFQWDEHLRMPFSRHTLSLGVKRAGILGKTVDSFFDFYAGGFLGMKGYPFYALGGNDIAGFNLTYRFPILQKIDFRILQFYFTKLYASVFADLGNSWTGTMPALRQWKRDAGFEFRLEAFSFYMYPTRFFFSGAYGFDRFTRTFQDVKVAYGKEWRFYLGVLFGFELGEIMRIR